MAMSIRVAVCAAAAAAASLLTVDASGHDESALSRSNRRLSDQDGGGEQAEPSTSIRRRLRDQKGSSAAEDDAFLTYHMYYPGQPLTQVSCSDGANGLITRWGHQTVDPLFPYVAATSNLNWNSPVCGTCYRVYSPDTQRTIYVTTIDKVGNPGPNGELHFDLSFEAFMEVAGDAGYRDGKASATFEPVSSSYCQGNKGEMAAASEEEKEEGEEEKEEEEEEEGTGLTVAFAMAPTEEEQNEKEQEQEKEKDLAVAFVAETAKEEEKEEDLSVAFVAETANEEENMAAEKEELVATVDVAATAEEDEEELAAEVKEETKEASAEEAEETNVVETNAVSDAISDEEFTPKSAASTKAFAVTSLVFILVNSFFNFPP